MTSTTHDICSADTSKQWAQCQVMSVRPFTARQWAQGQVTSGTTIHSQTVNTGPGDVRYNHSQPDSEHSARWHQVQPFTARQWAQGQVMSGTTIHSQTVSTVQGDVRWLTDHHTLHCATSVCVYAKQYVVSKVTVRHAHYCGRPRSTSLPILWRILQILNSFLQTEGSSYMTIWQLFDINIIEFATMYHYLSDSHNLIIFEYNFTMKVKGGVQEQLKQCFKGMKLTWYLLIWCKTHL